MALRRTPFAIDEWYHCYNRGVEKRRVFETKRDHERFMQLLYLCNSKTILQRSNILKKSNNEIYALKRGRPLVAIGSYTLMPNHFHVALKEIFEGGITAFMHKLSTAYTMYFNIKNKRVGGLFVKPFRSKHVGEDRYLKYLVQYIHLNPAELFEKDWKHGNVVHPQQLMHQLTNYPYSSFLEYHSRGSRPERAILDKESFELLADGAPSAEEMIREAAEYYKEFDDTLNVKASP